MSRIKCDGTLKLVKLPAITSRFASDRTSKKKVCGIKVRRTEMFIEIVRMDFEYFLRRQ